MSALLYHQQGGCGQVCRGHQRHCSGWTDLQRGGLSCGSQPWHSSTVSLLSQAGESWLILITDLVSDPSWVMIMSSVRSATCPCAVTSAPAVTSTRPGSVQCSPPEPLQSRSLTSPAIIHSINASLSSDVSCWRRRIQWSGTHWRQVLSSDNWILMKYFPADDGPWGGEEEIWSLESVSTQYCQLSYQVLAPGPLTRGCQPCHWSHRGQCIRGEAGAWCWERSVPAPGQVVSRLCQQLQVCQCWWRVSDGVQSHGEYPAGGGDTGPLRLTPGEHCQEDR